MAKRNNSKLKTKLLKHLRQDVYCKVAASDVHGVGVFAIRPIAKGINPFKGVKPYREVSISWRQLQSLPHRVRGLIDIFCYFENGNVLIPEFGLNRMDIAFYVNHSTNPNIAYEKNGLVKTIRAIAVGKELTMNYDAAFGGKHIF